MKSLLPLIEASLCRVRAGRQFYKGDHVGLDIISDFRIGLQFGQGSRCGQGLAAIFESFCKKLQGLWCVAQCLVDVVASGGATGQVWKPDAYGVIRSSILDNGNVVSHV